MQAIKKRLISLPDKAEGFTLAKVFESLFNNQTLSSAVLTGGASATVTTGAAFNAIVNGVLVSKATAQSLAALNGPTVLNTGAVCQAWVFTMDSSGTMYTYPGVPGATIAAITLPLISDTVNVNGAAGFGLPQVVVGMLTINNTSVGSFIPATTLLNVANLAPIFNNTVGPFFPIQTL